MSFHSLTAVAQLDMVLTSKPRHVDFDMSGEGLPVTYTGSDNKEINRLLLSEQLDIYQFMGGQYNVGFFVDGKLRTVVLNLIDGSMPTAGQPYRLILNDVTIVAGEVHSVEHVPQSEMVICEYTPREVAGL